MDSENNRRLRRWSFIGIPVVFFLATGWHFLYDIWPNVVTAAIAPVNESPWEHAKLFFVPAIIYYTILYIIEGKNYPNFFFAHSIALLIMPVFMLLFYSVYSSLLEETFVFDIINTLLTVSLGALVGYRLTTSEKDLSTPWHHAIAMTIVIFMLCVYIVFTWRPPHIDLFLDQTQMKYGI